MNNPELLIFQPKVTPDFIRYDVKAKLGELSIPIDVYFCIAAIKTPQGINEKNIIGLKFKNILTAQNLNNIRAVIENLEKMEENLQIVDFQDEVFHVYFNKIDPVIKIYCQNE